MTVVLGLLGLLFLLACLWVLVEDLFSATKCLSRGIARTWLRVPPHGRGIEGVRALHQLSPGQLRVLGEAIGTSMAAELERRRRSGASPPEPRDRDSEGRPMSATGTPFGDRREP